MPTEQRNQDSALPLLEKKRARRTYSRKDEVVLEAAERAFLENGFAGTSMDQVAQLADVSKRTVYSNFGSKDALFAAVIRKRCATVLPGPTDEPPLTDREPAAVLEELGVAFLEAIYQPAQIALFRTVMTEAKHLPDLGALMFEGPIMHSQHMFANYLRAQVQRGRLTVPDADLAAAQFVGMLKTDVHMRLLFNQPVNLTRAKIVDIVRASVVLFLAGADPARRD